MTTTSKVSVGLTQDMVDAMVRRAFSGLIAEQSTPSMGATSIGAVASQRSVVVGSAVEKITDGNHIVIGGKAVALEVAMSKRAAASGNLWMKLYGETVNKAGHKVMIHINVTEIVNVVAPVEKMAKKPNAVIEVA